MSGYYLAGQKALQILPPTFRATIDSQQTVGESRFLIFITELSARLGVVEATTNNVIHRVQDASARHGLSHGRG